MSPSDNIPDFIKGSIVTEEKYKEATNHFFQKSERMIILKTPKKDTKLIEELLEIQPGSLGDSFIKVPKDAKHCTCCGRQYSVLDITNVGINVHGRQLTKDIITGTYGYIWNRTVPTGITCYDCKKRGDIGIASYWIIIYACS